MPPRGIDFVWAEGVRLVDAQLRFASDLDAKLSPLIALVAAALALVYSQGTVIGDVTALLVIELMVTLVFLLLSFNAREFAFAPALPALTGEAHTDARELKTLFLGNLNEAYLLNLNSISIKLFFLRWATYAVAFLGVTLTAIALLVGPSQGSANGGM